MQRSRAEARPAGGAHAPLTIGTAGHIDHGKTALVRALTGVDTDRLPQEHERGISIELGFAALDLPSGRRLSVVDVPGHERFVRTMVAGATGIDAFLLVVAADDGVMPQTREHLRVLEALGVPGGVVALTKVDAVPPERLAPAAQGVSTLLDRGPYSGCEIVAVSALRETGLDELRAALDRMARRLPGRSAEPGPARLHIDRSFTLRGIGTVVTGTLWAGELTAGERVRLEPSGAEHRIRSLQVHGVAVDRAAAGQRVAVSLAGADRNSVSRGDVVTHPGTDVKMGHAIDARLTVAPGMELKPGARVQVHHGTRETSARLVALETDRIEAGGPVLVRLRLERPLAAVTGDRLVIRRIAPPDTLGGGTVTDTAPRSRGVETAAGRRPRPEPEASTEELELAARLERELAGAGLEPPRVPELAERVAAVRGDVERQLSRLARAGSVVRAGRDLYFEADALGRARGVVVETCRREGAVTIARLRDELGTSRRYAQALLERFDGERLLVRVGEEHRLRGASFRPSR